MTVPPLSEHPFRITVIDYNGKEYLMTAKELPDPQLVGMMVETMLRNGRKDG